MEELLRVVAAIVVAAVAGFVLLGMLAFAVACRWWWSTRGVQELVLFEDPPPAPPWFRVCMVWGIASWALVLVLALVWMIWLA